VTQSPFTGCVLTGGASSRMGRDKAILEFEGRPLAVIAIEALSLAGAERVFCLGGDRELLRSHGVESYPDTEPGQGPLAAVIEAFSLSETDVLMVLACDLPRASAASIDATLRGLTGPYSVALPEFGGRRQYLHGAYHRCALPTLQHSFNAGERSLRRALQGLQLATVEVPDPASLADADLPEDLAQPDG
jgi:molybdopterin-guanine dinucleotide biosynthesis protein A